MKISDVKDLVDVACDNLNKAKEELDKWGDKSAHSCLAYRASKDEKEAMFKNALDNMSGLVGLDSTYMEYSQTRPYVYLHNEKLPRGPVTVTLKMIYDPAELERVEEPGKGGDD